MRKKRKNQVVLFDKEKEIFPNKVITDSVKTLTSEEVVKLKSYALENYIKDIENEGLEKTWNAICEYILSYGENENFLNIENFGKMYEIGLAIINKQSKKESGQYYTPDDVAKVMSGWFKRLDGFNICDVGCGTGKLILALLYVIGPKKARKIISKGRLYLYDLDKIALKICKTSIMVKYGQEFESKINDICCDFLDKNIVLPENCKVISNPPYATISSFNDTWEKTEVLLATKEYYSAFMEKIIKQSKSSVIITPFGFISGEKFYSLRKILSEKSGEIYSFDNVPGNIFFGKKHGVFNTNTSNSVRAAITVIRSDNGEKGFRLTPLIRFKAIEREKLLNCKTLEKMLSKKIQMVSEKEPMFYKCHKKLENVFEKWNECSNGEKLKDYISKNGKYIVSMPNTCRYYTTASNSILNRKGQINIKFEDEDVFNFVYCMINSSFVYWYWRLYDGGITYSKNLLLNVPMIYSVLSDDDKIFFKHIADKMIKKADKYKIIKNNVGSQENIRYPRKYRDKINKKMLEILSIKTNYKIFDLVHSNMATEISL